MAASGTEIIERIPEVMYSESYVFDKCLFIFLLFVGLIVLDIFISSIIISLIQCTLKYFNWSNFISELLEAFISNTWKYHNFFATLVAIVIAICLFSYHGDMVYLFKYGDHLLLLTMILIIIFPTWYFFLYYKDFDIMRKIFNKLNGLIVGLPIFLFYVSVMICMFISDYDGLSFVYDGDRIVAEAIKGARYGEYLLKVEYDKITGKMNIIPKLIKSKPQNTYDKNERKATLVDKDIKSDEKIPFGIYMFYDADMLKLDVVLNVCLVVDDKIVKDLELDDFIWWDSYILDNMNKALDELKIIANK